MSNKEVIVQQPGTTSSQKRYETVPSAEGTERSTFDRSHKWASPLREAGRLYPILVDEYMPGDTFKCKTTAFVRLATPLQPIMDTLHVDIHTFCVANRLVYSDWPYLLGERKTIDDDPSNYSVPTLTVDLSPFRIDDGLYLPDYMGLPVGNADGATIEVNAMPIRAYNLIVSEWFRDQNVESEKTDQELNSLAVAYRHKHKDYFTSALPFAQRGDPVVIPIGQEAIVRVGPNGETVVPDGTLYWTNAAGTFEHYQSADPGGSLQIKGGVNPPGTIGDNQLFADLTEATSTSINDLRTAFQIQRLLERDARSGVREVEVVLAHFGVMQDDRRQFRPELLGVGTGIINISPVASTVATTEAPQGDLSAVGTGITTCQWEKSFTEHGHVISLISVRSELTYQQGIEKMWSRRSRYDFYWPVFQHLGEQAVLNKEIYADGSANDDLVFGYQGRWDEYRIKLGRICNRFRSAASASLDVWHLAQDFSEVPTLNVSFLRDIPPVNRIIAVPSESHFLADVWHEYYCTRPMPVYNVPGLIDHF